ncbi:hypothetical protein [Streptococcus parasanguinis]|uniref:hypothetical protein n=1 Tax=Streptococcus parasanguinis TaxID=1318 RepID=UPI002000DAE1|nr:hypothetical protein [Streptococcus parasanguinis]MDU6947135.1 hypothetical protein [Streptococcus parasanguinis]
MFELFFIILCKTFFHYRREFENSFICIPKKTVYDFEIKESEGGMTFRQKENSIVYVSLFSTEGKYVALYLRDLTPAEFSNVITSLITLKADIGYERLISMLLSVENEHRVELLKHCQKKTQHNFNEIINKFY